MLLAIPLIILIYGLFSLACPTMSAAMMAPIVAFFKQLFSPLPLVGLIKWLEGKTVALASLFGLSMGNAFDGQSPALRDYLAHHGEIAKYNQNSRERTKALLWGYANWNTNVDLPRAIKDTTGPLGVRVTALEHAKGKTRPAGLTGPEVAVVAHKSATVTIPVKIRHDIAEIEWLRGQHKLIYDITHLHQVPAKGVPVEATQTPSQALARAKSEANRRFIRLEKLLGASGLVAAMGVAIGLPLAKMLKCNSFKALRKLPACGPGSIMAGLAGLLIDAAILSDICAAFPLFDQGLALIEKPLVEFTSEVGAGLCHGDFTAPPKITLNYSTAPALG